MTRIMKKIFFAMLTTLQVAGCAKENLVEPMGPQNGVTVLTAGIPTKTVLLNDQKVLWTSGDKLNVNGFESDALELDEPAATATFTIQGVISNPYKAVFPASIYKDEQTVALPAVQTYAEGSFGATSSPMAAYQAAGNNLNFKHLCAVIKLNIAKAEDADEIMYVEFYGKNDEQVCGDFLINFEEAVLSGVSTKLSDKKVRCNVNEGISDTGIAVYVAVPAGEYKNGYTVKVVDTEGHYMEVSKQSGQTLEKGKIYDMPSFAFVPTGTEFNVGVTNAQEFIAYCKNTNLHAAGSVAALLNDIEFTAEDCANFTSIGTLSGTLKGNHYTISGFNTGKPIVSSAAATALIENLTVSGSAVISSIPKSGADGAFGTFYSYNNGGTLVNCQSAVNYTFGAMTWSTVAQLKIAGLVGDNRTSGSVKDCVNSGSLDFTSDFDLSGHSTSNNLRIGGVVAVNVKGTIENAEMSGDLKFSGKLGTQKLYIGGLVGENQSDVVSCYTSVSSEILNNTASTTGTLNFAGVVGYNSSNVQKCINNAVVSNLSSSSDRRSAGICSENTGTISDCINAGEILIGGHNASSFHIGGLIARNNSASISKLTNTATVTIGLSNTASVTGYLRAGGCIGICQTAIDGAGLIQNNGDVVWNSINGFTGRSNYPCEIGGVIGMSQGNVKGCVNSGNVVLNEATADADGSYLYMGGIVGYATNSVTISECTNNGRIDFNVTATEGDATGTRQYSSICLGGIVGRNNNKLTISQCVNNGIVDGGLRDYNNNLASCYYGGIIGYLSGNSSSIAKCNVRASVSNRTYNNSFDNLSNAVFCGGVAGYVIGGENARIKISDCNVMTEAAQPVTVQSVRGRTGGVVGYANYVDLSNCDVNVYSHFAHQCYGGICAQMVASSATGCDVNVDHHSTFNHYAGGFVGLLDGASVLDGCTVRCALSHESNNGNKILGLLAGYVSATGSEIKNSQYSGTLLGESSTTLVGKCMDGVSVALTGNTPLAE